MSSELVQTPLVGVVMGSKSDWSVVSEVAPIFWGLSIPFDRSVNSAHRTPDRTIAYAKSAKDRGLEVIIAAAGGSAHLPGIIAGLTRLPVIGLPIESKYLKGVDSVWSMVNMPPGVPVGCMAINGAKNAALFAAAILAIKHPRIAQALERYRTNQTADISEHPEEIMQP